MDRQDANPEAKNLKFANHGNHSKAQMQTKGLNAEMLQSISVPALIIHGVEDPIFPPAHAEVMGEEIPQSKLLLIENMGHAFSPYFFDTIIAAMAAHLAR